MKKMIDKEAMTEFYSNNPVLIDFFEKTRKEYVKWLNSKRIEWLNILKEIWNEPIFSIRWEIRQQKIKKFGNRFVVNNAETSDKDWEEKVAKYVNREIEAHKEQLYNRIGDKAGNIKKVFLKFAIDGTIEGIIEGDKATVSINVIGAGGYNVQRFHFRTLIKVVKD